MQGRPAYRRSSVRASPLTAAGGGRNEIATFGAVAAVSVLGVAAPSSPPADPKGILS